MISLIDLVFIYTLYVIAIGIVYDFEITIFESLKKSITLPLTPFKHLKSALTPHTPLQKEIKEEERTIKQLEAQKADIERLEELRGKREALFEEVGDKHVERVEEEREEVLHEYGTGRMYTIRKCPKCEERAMVYYGGLPEYDWLCFNCRHSEFENELESLCISCGKGNFEYKRYKTPSINIYQCTYCCKEIRQKTWKGARE